MPTCPLSGCGDPQQGSTSRVSTLPGTGPQPSSAAGSFGGGHCHALRSQLPEGEGRGTGRHLLGARSGRGGGAGEAGGPTRSVGITGGQRRHLHAERQPRGPCSQSHTCFLASSPTTAPTPSPVRDPHGLPGHPHRPVKTWGLPRPQAGGDSLASTEASPIRLESVSYFTVLFICSTCSIVEHKTATEKGPAGDTASLPTPGVAWCPLQVTSAGTAWPGPDPLGSS